MQTYYYSEKLYILILEVKSTPNFVDFEKPSKLTRLLQKNIGVDTNENTPYNVWVTYLHPTRLRNTASANSKVLANIAANSNLPRNRRVSTVGILESA